MKRILVLSLVAMLTMNLFVGCGGDSEDIDNTVPESGASESGSDDFSMVNLADVTVEDYVTLGDYKNLQVTPMVEVTEDEIEQTAIMVFEGMLTEETIIEHREIVEGDTVYISFVGLKDGVAFDDGTGESYLTIGSGLFIPGFEEGLVGVMSGTQVDLDLTFPEDYYAEDLMGQEVVFEVEVLYITCPMEDEYMELVTSGDYTTVDEFKEFIREYITATAENSYILQVENEILGLIIEDSTFTELPEDLVEKYRVNITTNLTSVALQYGMDLDNYCLAAYGIEAQECVEIFSENAVKQGLAFQAIANIENLNVTDEETYQGIEQMIAGSEFATVEDFLGSENMEEYKEYFMFEKVLAFLIENILA